MLLSVCIWAYPEANLLHISQVLGIIFGTATILLVVQFSWRLHRRVSVFGLIGGAFLAMHSAFVAWSTSGLETIFFTFLVFAGSFAYVCALSTGKLLPVGAALFGLAALTRPEGLLFFAVASAHLLVSAVRSERPYHSRHILGWFLAFIALYVPYYVWRFTYYGYPLPNTFYTKVSTGLWQYLRGVRYVLEHLWLYGPCVFLLPLPLLFKKPWESWRALFFLQVGVYAVYVVYVGGDGLPFFRFIVPIIPLLYILVQEGFIEIYGWGKRYLAPQDEWKIALPALLLLGVLLGFTGRHSLMSLLFPNANRWREPQSELTFPGTGHDHTYLWFDNYFVDRLTVAARWLEDNAPPNAVVAATPAGAIAYYMHLPVIDMLGLNDVHIAHTTSLTHGKGRAGHDKGDGKYVLSRSPDYILLGNVAVLPRPLSEAEMAQKLVLKSEHEIWAAPDFHDRYEHVSVKLSDQGVFQYFTFYKKKR